MIEKKSESVLPEFGFDVPIAYTILWERKLINFNRGESGLMPWYYLDSEGVFDLTAKWPKASRKTPLVCFARRYDSDDLACFDVESNQPKRIVVVHGWTPEGYDVVASCDDFWSWVKRVIDDIAETSDLLS